jgi:hypothetical protein
MIPTRNDPCPCGSGRKFKHCCLAARAAAPTELNAALWRRVRRELEGRPERMLRYVLDTYGACALDEAWAAFGQFEDDWPESDLETELSPVFLPWAYHVWAPDPATTEVADQSLHGVPPTRAWLARKGRHMDREVVRYLEGCLRERFGFHEVMTCDPGNRFVARGLWDDTPRTVLEASASCSLLEGDMIYAQLVPVGDFWMMEACTPRKFAPADRAEAIALVRRLLAQRSDARATLDPESLRKAENLALHRHFLELLARMDRRTELRNTDGDLIAFQVVHFRVASPRLAFVRLSVLDAVRPDQGRRATTEDDRNPDDFKIGFDWTREGNALGPAWENTVLGRFEIVGHTLTLSVNSDERAALGRQFVEQTLAGQVDYLLTKRQPTPEPRGGAQLTLSTTALDTDDPDEAQRAVDAMVVQHYENWPDMPLPALDGRTPLEAVADPAGRAMVAALVDQIERGTARGVAQVSSAVIARLRERLGV